MNSMICSKYLQQIISVMRIFAKSWLSSLPFCCLFAYIKPKLSFIYIWLTWVDKILCLATSILCDFCASLEVEFLDFDQLKVSCYFDVFTLLYIIQNQRGDWMSESYCRYSTLWVSCMMTHYTFCMWTKLHHCIYSCWEAAARDRVESKS